MSTMILPLPWMFSLPHVDLTRCLTTMATPTGNPSSSRQRLFRLQHPLISEIILYCPPFALPCYPSFHKVIFAPQSRIDWRLSLLEAVSLLNLRPCETMVELLPSSSPFLLNTGVEPSSSEMTRLGTQKDMLDPRTTWSWSGRRFWRIAIMKWNKCRRDVRSHWSMGSTSSRLDPPASFQSRSLPRATSSWTSRPLF